MERHIEWVCWPAEVHRRPEPPNTVRSSVVHDSTFHHGMFRRVCGYLVGLEHLNFLPNFTGILCFKRRDLISLFFFSHKVTNNYSHSSCPVLEVK